MKQNRKEDRAAKFYDLNRDQFLFFCSFSLLICSYLNSVLILCANFFKLFRGFFLRSVIVFYEFIHTSLCFFCCVFPHLSEPGLVSCLLYKELRTIQ
jgi:hypothetical protein